PKNLTNHSGNGIVVGGVDRCLIEYCEAANNGWDMPRKGNGPVGIWAWNASRVTIQRCISHENRSPGDDGGGFDFDGGVTDSVLQYNLSFGNAGTGYLLCQYGGGGRWKNNVVRHNISYEDGLRSFGSGIALYIPKGMDNMSDALIEHNTIVSSRYAVSTVGDLPGMIYRNNAFLSGGETLNLAWGEGGFKNSTFGKNLAWSATRPNPVLLGVSPFSSIEAWEETGGLSSDPSLLLPTSIADLPTDPRSLAKMGFFRPLEGSPCLVGRSQLLGARL
ncbi:right-handed parallel beta-helix repeat-containing protein, partial [bacterium]